MASRLRDICFDCADHHRVARFWAEVLGYTVRPGAPGETADNSVAIESTDGSPRIWYNKVPEPKLVKNRVHIDINLPDGAEMERLHRLGARALQEIRDDRGRLKWTIMADPEGNEFCAFPPPSAARAT
jgi:Glyoxalase-like domain